MEVEKYVQAEIGLALPWWSGCWQVSQLEYCLAFCRAG